MSKVLDRLLFEMNDSMEGRLESDIPLIDGYWKRRDAYQQALHEADGVHVPEPVEEVVEPLLLTEGIKQESNSIQTGFESLLDKPATDPFGFGN